MIAQASALLVALLAACGGGAPPDAEPSFARPAGVVATWAYDERATDGVTISRRGLLARSGTVIVTEHTRWRESPSGEAGSSDHTIETMFGVPAADVDALLSLLDGPRCVVSEPTDAPGDPLVRAEVAGERAASSHGDATPCSPELLRAIRSLTDRATRCSEAQPPTRACEHRTTSR